MYISAVFVKRMMIKELKNMNNGFYINDENRLHLNLSNYAMYIIKVDMITFKNDCDLTNKSRFINRIITNYYDKFPLSVNVALKNFKAIEGKLINEDFGKKLTNTVISEFSDEIMKNLINEYKNKYESENQFKIRLSNKNVELFQSLEEEKYIYKFAPRSATSFYLKILLESYARLKSEQRQKIYYGETFKILESSINNKTYIKIKKEKEFFKCSPVMLYKPRKQKFHQLIYVGTGNNHQTISLIDIKDIKYVRELREKSMVGNDLRSFIKSQVPKYLNRASNKKKQEFTVKFTKHGLERFFIEEDNISLIGIASKEDKYTYVFSATETDIFNYLFKFGAQALIISPIDSREKFGKMYEVAAKKYLEED